MSHQHTHTKHTHSRHAHGMMPHESDGFHLALAISWYAHAIVESASEEAGASPSSTCSIIVIARCVVSAPITS